MLLSLLGSQNCAVFLFYLLCAPDVLQHLLALLKLPSLYEAVRRVQQEQPSEKQNGAANPRDSLQPQALML